MAATRVAGSHELALAHGPAVILEPLGAGVNLVPEGQHPVGPDLEIIGTEPDGPIRGDVIEVVVALRFVVLRDKLLGLEGGVEGHQPRGQGVIQHHVALPPAGDLHEDRNFHQVAHLDDIGAIGVLDDPANLEAVGGPGAGDIQPGGGQLQLVEPGLAGLAFHLDHRVLEQGLGVKPHRAEALGVKLEPLGGGDAGLADGDLHRFGPKARILEVASQGQEGPAGIGRGAPDAPAVQAPQQEQRLLLGEGVLGQDGLGRQEGQGRAAEPAGEILGIVMNRLGLAAQQRFQLGLKFRQRAQFRQPGRQQHQDFALPVHLGKLGPARC